MNRIKDKLADIKKFVKELQSIIPKSVTEYKNSLEKKAACERYVEKIVEAATDAAFLIIKSKHLKIPDDDYDAFTILQQNAIISNETCEKLKKAKGMRNIIVHDYGERDDEIIFEAITKQLTKDAMQFIKEAGRL